MASTNRYAALGAGPLKSASPPRISSPDTKITSIVSSDAPEHSSDRDEAAVEEGREVVAGLKKHKKKSYASEDEEEEMREEIVESRGIDEAESLRATDGTGVEATRKDSKPLPPGCGAKHVTCLVVRTD